MTNISDMLDHLLININHTPKQTKKRKGQGNLISSAGTPENF